MKSVIFISECKLRAGSRTALVLDGYAMRHGNRTWITPITLEGLKAVRARLRATATRQTAVACYLTTGTSLDLVWTVGARNTFSPTGLVPVARKTAHKEPLELPAGMRTAALLAKTAGYCHDLGKFSQMFAGKLRRALRDSRPEADDVRHEWISQKLMFEALRTGSLQNMERDWKLTLWDAKVNVYKSLRTTQGDVGLAALQLSQGLNTPTGALFFLVFTHHHLPPDQVQGGARNLISERRYVKEHFQRDSEILKRAGDPLPETWSLIGKSLRRLEALPEASTLYWRAAASIARMALILSDHSVSSRRYPADPKKPIPDNTIYANTKDDLKTKRKVYDQPLDWHLTEVGGLASRMLHLMWNFAPPALSPQARKRIAKPSEGRFAWQTTCARGLTAARARSAAPTLLFNIAGTGTGKTRMNVVALDALRKGEDLRIAACFNLRTLTTQTHDAYIQQLKISPEECALVMGGATAPVKVVEDEDGNADEDIFDAFGDADPPPEFIANFLQRTPTLTSIIMSPIVVATIDYLVKAGDPNQKANHALTNLRMMKSDLIIDEVDSFEPRALVCVVKLVTAAAMWGRNVVVSSATMSEPVAKTLHEAFDLGIRMAAEMGIVPSTIWRAAVIDNHRGLHVFDGGEFNSWFKQQLTGLMASLALQPRCRPVELVRMDEHAQKPAEHFNATVATTVKTMHFHHGHRVVVDGVEHTISFGLVRVANVGVAVRMAELLCTVPAARVACYHSNLNFIHRQLLEKVLDQVLNRNGDQDEWREMILGVPEIRDAIEAGIQHGFTETLFVVVATPVEEIGRDHDFDWAVLEPSSAQSLVQAAGRVNRHRQIAPAGANVAILQYNLRHLLNVSRSQSEPCFVWPGFEEKIIGSTTSHPSHDLADLLGWDALAGGVDARMRYDTQAHALARYDDSSATRQIDLCFRYFLDSDSDMWFGADTYHRLREGPPTARWTIDANGNHLREERVDGTKMRHFVPRPELIGSARATPGAWLAWPLEELLAIADGDLKAMVVQLPEMGDPDKKQYDRHSSFGYFRP